MHPVITQAIAAELAGELRAAALAAGRARRLGRSRSPRRWWPVLGTPGAGCVRAVPAARGSLRGPRAA